MEKEVPTWENEGNPQGETEEGFKFDNCAPRTESSQFGLEQVWRIQERLFQENGNQQNSRCMYYAKYIFKRLSKQNYKLIINSTNNKNSTEKR